MAVLDILAVDVFAGYNPDGSARQIVPHDAQVWGTMLEALINSGSLGDNWYATESDLDADLAHDAGTVAVVYNDGTRSNNGFYKKIGASGSGSWTQLTSFLPGYQFVKATNTNSGDPNAIEATTSPALPGGDGTALVRLNFVETNTSEDVTVEFDSNGTTYIIKTVTDEKPPIGRLKAGSSALGTVEGDGTVFRLATDFAIAIDWQGSWATSSGYATNDAVKHNGASYIATSAHVASSTTEPGAGADWQTVWDLLAQKGDAGGAGESLPSVASSMVRRNSANTDYEAIPAATVAWFATIAGLRSDTDLAYSSGSPTVSAGNIVEAQGRRFQVAASGASDQHEITAGGVKLYEAGPIFSTFERMVRAPLPDSSVIVTGGDRAGIFYWDSSDLSSTLTPRSITSTSVDDTTDTITSAAHGLWTGEPVFPTSAGDGLTAETIYYVIRSDANSFQLAASAEDAVDGTAVDLTGTTNLTFKTHADPNQGIYVIPTGYAFDGSQGALVRNHGGIAQFKWWGADSSGTEECFAELRAAVDSCVALGIENVHNFGTQFDITGGRRIHKIADSAVMRIKGGKIFSTDGTETNNFFDFVLFKEFNVKGVVVDGAYEGSTDIDDYVDGRIAFSARGCEMFKARGCSISSMKGDAFYTSRDTSGNGTGSDRNTGIVDIQGNYLHNCKRNYVALTDYTHSFVDYNVCTSSGEDGEGNPYVWARSAVLDFEPNSSADAMGYGECTGNQIKVTGAKNPIRWAVGSSKIPHIYESIVCTYNTIECTGVDITIPIEARGSVKTLKLDGNIAMEGEGAANSGMLVVGFTGRGTCNGNEILCASGAGHGVYFNTVGAYEDISPQTRVSIVGGSYIKDASGDFRAVRVSSSTGAVVNVAGVYAEAVNSTQSPIYVTGVSSTKKLARASLVGNNADGFSTPAVIQWAEKATASANTTGGVSGSGNDLEDLTGGNI